MENVNGWRKSSYSGNGGGNCVEVGQDGYGSILVRDTKQHGSGPIAQYPASAWREFISRVKGGRPQLRELGGNQPACPV
jgi:hypothetical protein